jgi:2-hydroxy-3-keto-5-methylthiopentenyl-1-phosphate phosphatase
MARRTPYRAIVSSDWNECLAPCGPFDFIFFTYPHLEPEISGIFKRYTENEIALSDAARRISSLLPAPITEDRMDAYLDERFATYRGVPELIEWCGREDILFMINTTGMQGYFQRVFRKGLLPSVPVVSAHPMIRFPEEGESSIQFRDLLEIQDKPVNTLAVMREYGIPADKVVLVGDSGGDGPHFAWGAGAGAFLIGSMTKWSLDQYCGTRRIGIGLYFGPRYLKGEIRKEDRERDIDFMGLTAWIKAIL